MSVGSAGPQTSVLISASVTFESKCSSERHITEALDEWYNFLSKILLAFDNIEMIQEIFPPETKKLRKQLSEFPGGSPVVRTLHIHCRGHELNPWSVN